LDGTFVEFVAQDYIAQQPIIPGFGGVDVWTFRGRNNPRDENA